MTKLYIMIKVILEKPIGKMNEFSCDSVEISLKIHLEKKECHDKIKLCYKL